MSDVLACRDVTAGYNKMAIVRAFALQLAPGEVVALVGPNGAGKTTLLLTLSGLIPRLGGEVLIGDKPVPSGDAQRASRHGLVLVPDDRALFTSLSVRDNIVLAQRKPGLSLTEALDFFPQLRNRIKLPAGALSGGEQQMLAMARALVQAPRVLLIDELSMGLAPIIVESLLPIVRQVADETSAGVVLVEQHVRLALGIADRALVLAHGEVVLTGHAQQLLDDFTLIESAYLGVEARNAEQRA